MFAVFVFYNHVSPPGFYPTDFLGYHRNNVFGLGLCVGLFGLPMCRLCVGGILLDGFANQIGKCQAVALSTRPAADRNKEVALTRISENSIF